MGCRELAGNLVSRVGISFGLRRRPETLLKLVKAFLDTLCLLLECRQLFVLIRARSCTDQLAHGSDVITTWLAVNGDVRQDGDIADMIWRVDETIAGISKLFTLAPGDLIFTGTPAGVGSIDRGNQITGGIDGVDEISISII